MAAIKPVNAHKSAGIFTVPIAFCLVLESLLLTSLSDYSQALRADKNLQPSMPSHD